MVKKNRITVSNFNYLTAKTKKTKKYIHDRRSTMTDEELLMLREKLGITPNDKNKPYRGGQTPKPL